MRFKKEFLKANYIAMIVTMIIVWTLGYDGLFSQSDSLVLLLLFGIYLYFLYQQEQQHSHHQEHINAPMGHIGLEFFWLILGMAALLGSSAVVLEVIQLIVYRT